MNAGLPRPLVLPRPLRKGSRLVVWAPSFPVGNQYPRRLARGVAELEKCGFEVRLDSTCTLSGGLTALPPPELAAALHSLLQDASVDGVLAAVGGWSINVILPYIDYELVRNARKPIVGYSDISALLLAILTRSQLMTFHGPALLSEWGEADGVWNYTRDHFLACVGATEALKKAVPPTQTTDEFLAWDRDDIRPREPRPATAWRAFRQGSATGRLVGGCMSTVALQLGTEYMPSLDGALLFLEEEATSPDRHLAYLESFRQQGVFRKISGLIMGRLSRPRPMTNGFADFDEPLRLALRDTEFPVALDVDVGHTEPMLTLPMGGEASLTCAPNGVELEFRDHIVAETHRER